MKIKIIIESAHDEPVEVETVYPSEMTAPPEPTPIPPAVSIGEIEEGEEASEVSIESDKGYPTSRRLAMEAWNRLKGEADPAAENLPEATQRRLELFAREIRNATIESLSGAVKRYYERTTATAVDSLLSLKE